MLLRLRADRPAVEVVWERPRRGRSADTLSPVIPDLLVMNGLAFGVQPDGERRCLELATGRRLWETTDLLP